ncbi:MAG: GNAT family N-acetyltransferase [Alphaproteobacteria bacterium]|nr:GNAT family N-acetyltransferase [Alphaproteobacteria bacterium]MBU0865439.1 GNAT family N-acetyltransferase [Alphaproteobacteria bacterium]MBU1826705.1 GNAT family N-acetyltransferase [Alphaproteobacteria bacterium]MBU2015381.1 GNAT family N-acetyltransferase [Alphaproteobacteria bacterium]
MIDPILPTRTADATPVVETLAHAFQTDPALSWILPDAAHRARALRSLFRTLVPADMRAGVALRSAGDEAAALWRAPGQAHGGTLEFLRTVLPLITTFGTTLPRGLKVQSGIDAHRPTSRFWYLHYVGVRTAHQGKGHGGRIIRAQTVVADAAGLPCWLETATPKNVPLYERLGFVTQVEWDVPGGGPHFWGMMRAPAA